MTERTVSVPAGVFVGREAQLDDLTTSVATERLTVLTGPPGVGKTRLAREVTARVAGAYPDGTCLVELASVGDPAQVPVAVARALAVWEQPDRPVVDSIIARLSSRRLLLVLDNCEHLLKKCAELVTALLAACPGLTIVATSQETLGVAGERVRPVPPLGVPDAGARPEQLAGSEAVALFLARAEAVQPGFGATEAKLGVIAEICRRLDGIPLAIELAAARVSMVTLRELADRLDHRFAVLTGNGPAPTPRHQTLRTALEWSYGLLSEPEQALLRALSVFPSGCTADAAAAVCGNARLSRIRELLARLVARSLVNVELGAQPRYRMLESIRIFAAERPVDSREAAAVRARQASWCVAFMERAEPALTGRAQIRWLRLVDDEYANLAAALAWAHQEGEAKLGLRLAGTLTVYWRVRGSFREGMERLTAAVGADHEQPASLRAKALWGVGFMALMLGDDATCVRASQQSLALARGPDDRRLRARAVLLLGNQALLVGHADAVGLLERSANEAHEAGDEWCLAHSLGMSGLVRLRAGDLNLARRHLMRSLRVGRRNADQQSLRLALLLLGELTAITGDLHRARSLLAEGLEIARALREPYAVAVAHAGLGTLARSQGDYAEAEKMLGVTLALEREMASASVTHTLTELAGVALDSGDFSLARRRYTNLLGMDRLPLPLLGLGELAMAEGSLQEARGLMEEARTVSQKRGARPFVAAATAGLARVAREEGNFALATGLHAEALTMLWSVGDTSGVARALEDMAGLAADLGAPDRAARLFGAGSAVRGRGGWARPPAQQWRYETDVALAKARLGAARFEMMCAQGAGMPAGHARAYAVRWKGTRGISRAAGGWGGLTMAERRVAGLVAEGMTNAEVAARLGISVRTVGNHLTSVFAMLGISSRRRLRRPAFRSESRADRY